MPKFDVDSALVRKLAKLLNETGLTELEYARTGETIRVSRASAAGPATGIAPVISAPLTAEPATDSDAPPAGAVLSPMVGTIYMSPEPGAPPFVQAGTSVTAGQTLLIIEAMKVMNPIPAPRAGRVARVLVENAQPVEYGEPLLVIE
jgi:acetyl-CoA carboxylase biotin carboxyl carrier protein